MDVESWKAWRFDLDVIFDRLALGVDLFDPYGEWLWAVPAFWLAASCAIWLHANWQQRRSDRAYLAYASRNLPVLRRIARQRAHEVAFSRRTDRF